MMDQQPIIATSEDEEQEEENGIRPTDTCAVNTGGRTGCFMPCRYMLVMMMMAGFFCALAQRMVFNIALVAMVNLTETTSPNITSDDCPVDPSSINSTADISIEGEFNWNSDLQALLLGAFFYGYPVSQLPFGYLAERFGGKVIFAFNGFSTGILSLLIPTVARWNPYALIVLRALQGFCQGSLYPTCLAMMSRWGPPAERNRMYSIVNSGATLGCVIAIGISGFLCQSKFLGGWPSTFYLFGGLSLIWSIAWLFIAYDTPAAHPRITAAERDYIKKETEGLDKVKYTNPPWCSILKSVPVWAVFIIICTDSFGFYITFSSLPLYMKQVLHFDMSQDGVMSALPYLVQYPMSLLVGVIADYARTHQIVRVVNIRRLAALIGELLPGVFLVLVGLVGCNKTAAVALLMLSLSANSFMLAGPAPSFFDLAPLYSGSLMGVLNGLGNIFGVISPLMVAKITKNSGDLSKWQTVFWIGGAIYGFGTLVYCTFISSNEQKWAKDKRKREEANTEGITPIVS